MELLQNERINVLVDGLVSSSFLLAEGYIIPAELSHKFCASTFVGAKKCGMGG